VEDLMKKSTVIAVFALLILASASTTFAGADLRAAFDQGEAKVLELLKADPQLLKADLGEGMTALHHAAYYGYAEVVDYALKNGVDINLKDRRGLTPVCFTVLSGRPEMLRKFIGLGADLSVKGPGGQGLFFAACGTMNPNIEVIRILLDKGFKPNEKDAQDMTPMDFALFSGSADIIKLLVEKGGVLEKNPAGGLPPLFRAAQRGSAVIHYLLDNGHEVNVKGPRGMTPLLMAVDVGNAEGARALVMRGADVNAVDEAGQTPLLLAVKKGSKELVELFLEKGAKPNIADARTGKTALHEMALRGYSGVVETLLANGADKNAKDKDGRTALSYALKYGNKTAAEALRKNGAEEVAWQSNLDDSVELEKALNKGEATIWYLKHSGFAIKTKSALMVFDYWDNDPVPDEKLLANGHVRPEEFKDLPVYVFVSHEHDDHFDPQILEWKKSIPNITYIFGFEPPNKAGITIIGPREQRTVGGLKVTTIKANDAGVGFAVQVDGLTIFHAGDHSNNTLEMKDNNFFPEIDFLAEKGIRPDIAFFLNAFGCGATNPEAFQKGIFYAVDKLKIKSCLPMHAANKEWVYKDLVDGVAKNNVKLQVGAAVNFGDRFFFSKGKLTS
jgi:ankyrin repeat protein/L-ascorbate metabolism protein UlaG (beta-lactamase superfamily)